MTKADKTRQFIIETAAPIINKKGMAGTSINDIMEATQLAKGGIYGNFASKDEICLAVFGFLSEKLLAGIDNALAQKVTPKDKLFALLDYYHDRLALADTGGCPMLNFGVEADDTSSTINKSVAETINAFQDRIRQLVIDGKSTGSFSQAVDADLFAIKLFAMLEGAILISRVFRSKAQIRAIVDLMKLEISSFST